MINKFKILLNTLFMPPSKVTTSNIKTLRKQNLKDNIYNTLHDLQRKYNLR